MSTFDKREEAFENKYAHDEELNFKVVARNYKLLGLWAAEKLGKTGVAAEDYANALVVKEVSAPAGSGVLKQVLDDFVAAGVAQSEHQISRTFGELRAQAVKDVTAA